MQKGSLNDLAEARYVFEPQVARLAAERATPEDLLRLEENIRETSHMIESNLGTELNINFHCLLAEATHNPVVESMIKAMSNVWKEWILELNDISKKLNTDAIDYHKMILKVLQEKNPEMAHELMLKHVYRTSLIPPKRPITHKGLRQKNPEGERGKTET